MPKLPNVTPVKDIPPDEEKPTKIPEGLKLKIEMPEETEIKEETPEETKLKEEMPPKVIEENCVTVNGNKIELKPTLLKYFRNKQASGFGVIKTVPIHELFTYEKGVLDPDRNADQLVYDFLIAAFNDLAFVRDNYNDMDADMLDRICKIFGRLNHIDEKEDAIRKNREAQAQAKR